jgi:hypothetical protein
MINAGALKQSAQVCKQTHKQSMKAHQSSQLKYANPHTINGDASGQSA